MARNILVVEDDNNISDLIRMYLEKEGFEVRIAADGGKAVEEFKAREPDLVLLDVMLPVLDGWGVCAKIRETSKCPIIMLTAKGEVNDRIHGLEMGADDYVVKPFEMKELLARIRAITRRKSEAVSADMIYGDCTLNSLNYELSSDGGSVKLQNKEYQIMELLMANQKSIISAELMMEKIWGYDTDTEISVVWVNISYLRKKLGQIGSKVSIKAVRNQGYTLEYSE